MPSNPSKGDSNKDTEEWISIGGKKVKIDPDEDKESLTRDVMPSLRGEKEKNTKEAQKVYKRRLDLIKSRLAPRDEVVFAEYNKSGVVAGFNGNTVNIMCEGRIYPIQKNDCFKKSELIGDRHWDTLTNVDRAELLKSYNLPTYYYKQNWGNLSPDIRGALLKNVSPAGTTTDTTGTVNPVFNPVNEEKTVSDTVKEEISRQHKSKNHEESESATDKKQYS